MGDSILPCNFLEWVFQFRSGHRTTGDPLPPVVLDPAAGGGEIITAAIVPVSVKLTASVKPPLCVYKVRIMRVLCKGARVQGCKGARV